MQDGMSYGFGSLDSFGVVMSRKSRFLGLFQNLRQVIE